MEGLRLKTVLTLVLEDYPDGNLKWCEERDVQFMVSYTSLTCRRNNADSSNSVFLETKYVNHSRGRCYADLAGTFR